jgi:hypothetical protein
MAWNFVDLNFFGLRFAMFVLPQVITWSYQNCISLVPNADFRTGIYLVVCVDTECSKYEETSQRSADWQHTRQRYARSCIQNYY